jgi:hypothetical protein
MPWYLKSGADSTLVGSFGREVVKAAKKIGGFLEYPDYDSMWEMVEASGAAMDISSLPLGYISRTPRSLQTLFTDPLNGVKMLLGYPDSRLKQ